MKTNDAGRTEGMIRDLQAAAARSVCYLTTRGRRTGRPHTIEIWFAVHAGRLYMLAGGGERADWLRNLRAEPRVEVRIDATTWPGRAAVIDEPAEDALARRLLATKYQGWREGAPLSSWARTALPVVVEFDASASAAGPARETRG